MEGKSRTIIVNRRYRPYTNRHKVQIEKKNRVCGLSYVMNYATVLPEAKQSD